MSDEFDALIHNYTMELTPSLPSQNLVGCKWVFETKRNANVSVNRAEFVKEIRVAKHEGI